MGPVAGATVTHVAHPWVTVAPAAGPTLHNPSSVTQTEVGMAGLHFSCGKWMGEDKSADPLFDIIPKTLSKYVAGNEQADWERFLEAFDEQGDSEMLELTPEMMRAIVGPLELYRDALVKNLGLSGPDASLEELGSYPRVLSEDESRLKCVRDMLAGNAVCQRSRKPIVVVFA